MSRRSHPGTIRRWRSAVKKEQPTGWQWDRSKGPQRVRVLWRRPMRGRQVVHSGTDSASAALRQTGGRRCADRNFGEHGEGVVSKGVGNRAFENASGCEPFQHFLKGLAKEIHKVELMKLSHSDRYRSTMLPSGPPVTLKQHSQSRTRFSDRTASPVGCALQPTGGHSGLMCVWIIATRRFMNLTFRRHARIGGLGY